MTAALLLLVIFAGISAVVYVDNTTKRGRALPPGGRAPDPLPTTGPARTDNPERTETLALRLTEPARTRAWALLCLVQDARQAEGLDARSTFLLTQTQENYLPETLRAYLGLTPGARDTLKGQGQPPEVLLSEQLTLLEEGVREVLRRDHAAADRLLTQGRFLRERFAAGELKLGDGT